jgi:hypothetical protein
MTTWEEYTVIFRGFLFCPARSFKLTLLMLLFVLSSTAVSDAGVMLSSIEADPAMVVAATPPADTSHDERQVIEPCDQEYGMTVTSGGGVVSPGPAVTDLLDDRSAQPILRQWLGAHGHVVIPDRIPLCLLKVPIVVA